MATSKLEINTPEEDKLTDIIVDKKNNIANNLVLFEEQISNWEISYSYSIDPRI